MRFLVPIPLVFLVFLSGCVGDQHQTQQPVLSSPQAPTINLPPVKLLSAEDAKNAIGTELDRTSGVLTGQVRQDIQASSNNTQQQLSGLVTTQISKLAEVMKGVEANLSATVNTQATATANLNTTLDTRLTANATAVANLETKLNTTIATDLQLQNTMQATITSTATANAELKLSLDRLTLQMQNMGAAVAGVGNKVDQVTNSNTAGHDVNYFPKEVVDVMLDREKSSSNRLLAVLGTIQALLLVVLRNSRERERLRADNEKFERQKMFDLLMETMTHVDPTKQADLRDKMASKGLTAPPPATPGGFRNLI